MSDQEKPTRIGILFFNGMEELDAIGPFEIFAYWARQAFQPVEVVTFSPDGHPVTCSNGLTVVPGTSKPDVGPLNVFVHPGGDCRALLSDPDHLSWVREKRSDTALLASVCTGSLVFAKAGLLAHRPATTWWKALDRLGEIDPSIEVRRDVRYVDDGDIVTSAGISAGMDMALHLVARLGTPQQAHEVARGIQYDYCEYGARAASA